MPFAELIEWIAEDDNRKKGEMVLLVHGYRDAGEQQQTDEALRTLTILTKELQMKKAAALVAEIHQLKRMHCINGAWRI